MARHRARVCESAVFTDHPPRMSANAPSAVTEGRGGQRRAGLLSRHHLLSTCFSAPGTPEETLRAEIQTLSPSPWGLITSSPGPGQHGHSGLPHTPLSCPHFSSGSGRVCWTQLDTWPHTGRSRLSLRGQSQRRHAG